MYFVNHAEATAFCQKLTEQERQAGRLPRGWEYRLPTDAQWEYACRAGTKTATAFGNTLSNRQANFNGNYPYNGAVKGPALGQMAEVGRYRPNAWGLYDMHGNAREWCRDCYQMKLPGGTDPEVMTNPLRSNGEAERVLRGGSWQSYGEDCRSARRFGYAPASRDNGWGFRVAVVRTDPKPKPDPQPDPKPVPKGTVVNSIGMKLAPIAAGKFLMGSLKDEPGRRQSGLGLVDYEEQHEVTIREPFYLGIYLVTQEQYQYVMGESPRYFPSYFSLDGFQKEKVKEFKDTKRFPQDCVSWDDAQEFCRRLSALLEEKEQKRVYRLPTEAEWEYACRGGTATRYYFGNSISKEQANFNGDLGRTTPVGHYANLNKFGLYDMHGNLWEWCEDFFGPYQKDPKNPKSETSHVLRGGSFVNYGYDCRSASRSGNSSNYAHVTTGFRVALSVGAPTR
jgi:formylglycine-generating enzyme required for sulfatase activity